MKRRDWFIRAALAAALLMLLFRYPREMAQGIRQGLTLCGTAVIPSLFPFLVLCTFFVRSGLAAGIGDKLDAPMRFLFRLPGSAAGAVLLGLCGGYPVGARMTAQLLESGDVSESQAQRMCLFCVAAGPAFVTGTVGASMLHSRSAGWLLFAALTLSGLTLGILLRFTDDVPQPSRQTLPRTGFARSVGESVAAAGGSLLSVCAWVMLFSGICAVLSRFPKAAELPLSCLLEVTNGCRIGAEAGLSLPVLAAILGFGGVSVHCQILPDVAACGVPLRRFWAFRALGGGLSAVYCMGLLRLFPQTQTAALLRQDVLLRPAAVSAPVSAALLLTAAVFILNTSRPSRSRASNG